MTLVLITRAPYLHENFQGLDISSIDFLRLFLYLIPSFLLILLPISCMLSVFLTYLRLNTDREFIALRAGGISIYQLILAPAFFSCICMGLAFFISLHGISLGMSQFRTLLLEIASTRAKVVVQPGVFNQDFIKGLTLFARTVDPITGKLKQVIFEDNRMKNNEQGVTIIAPEGEIVTDESTGQLVFSLFNGHVYRMDKTSVSTLSFDEYAINIALSGIFSSSYLSEIKPKDMSWEILCQVSEGEKINSSTQLLALVEIQKRLSLPFSCLILGLFAVPLACSFEGVNRQVGAIISIVMFLLYYSFFSLGMSFGQSGRVDPRISLWMANIFFTIITIIGFYLVGKEKTLSFQIFKRKMFPLDLKSMERKDS